MVEANRVGCWDYFYAGDREAPGYMSMEYAESLREWGDPMDLGYGARMLRRAIPGTSYYDLMGVYPLMCCDEWDTVKHRLGMWQDHVSAVWVADPLSGDWDTSWLDVHRHYKDHFLVDYNKPLEISKHHRYYTRQFDGQVEVVTDPDVHEWTMMYDTLVDKHGITGIQRFSRWCFGYQFENVPGLVAFHAYDRNIPLGMHLWYIQGNVAYSHLAACSHWGYQRFASYALMQYALEFFANSVRYLDLGGVTDGDGNGLQFFKRGWSNDTIPAYLCGKILDREKYEELSSGRETEYFPAYRG